MPHHPDDSRYAHLQLIREEPNPDRRMRQPPPRPAIDSDARAQSGGRLRVRIGEIEQEVQTRPPQPAGIQPHLVFRVPLTAGASSSQLSEALGRLGIATVGVDPDGAIIAFQNDADLGLFRDALSAFIQGPQSGVNPQTQRPYSSTQWDVFQFIDAEQMRQWGRTDRIGQRLATTIGRNGERIDLNELYVVEIELWHRGTRDLARAAIDEVRQLISDRPNSDERLRDHFAGDLLCLAKVSVRGAKLSQLLDLDIIAEAELPPTPLLDMRSVRQATARDFPTPPPPQPGSPRLCILDSGVTSNHPLLASNIGYAASILTQHGTVSDRHGHGTMVAGVAVFGDVRGAFAAGYFASDVTLFSARVLNDQNRFDDERLILEQMREAIVTFHQEPYNCRVFNLSLGADRPWLRDNRRQSLWAECLDHLAREMKVLIVVSAGNHKAAVGDRASEAEAVMTGYPDFLFGPDCGLCEPATAALALTVGGIAQHDSLIVRRGANQDDVARPVAGPGEPTPSTRIGPGLNGAVKPEFVAHAGNLSFEGHGSHRRICGFGDASGQTDADPGLAVMSFSNHPIEALFNFSIGTSFAAPKVARTAAYVWHQLRGALGEEPHPNLVRAVLAAAADVPPALHSRIHPTRNDEGVRQVCGFGEIDEDFALNTGDHRVTLVAQSQMRIDSFHLYEVPTVSEFRRAPGRKRVIVSLAYDPPVRRRRLEYLGVGMKLYLIRGRTIDQIVEAYRAVTRQERESARRQDRDLPGALNSPYKCSLQPNARVFDASTLHRYEFHFTRDNDEYGDNWYVLVRADRNWAPESITMQDFGLAVVLQANEPQLFNVIRQRQQTRIRQRARATNR